VGLLCGGRCCEVPLAGVRNAVAALMLELTVLWVWVAPLRALPSKAAFVLSNILQRQACLHWQQHSSLL